MLDVGVTKTTKNSTEVIDKSIVSWAGMHVDAPSAEVGEYVKCDTDGEVYKHCRRRRTFTLLMAGEEYTNC